MAVKGKGFSGFKGLELRQTPDSIGIYCGSRLNDVERGPLEFTIDVWLLWTSNQGIAPLRIKSFSLPKIWAPQASFVGTEAYVTSTYVVGTSTLECRDSTGSSSLS
ncbi:hypothetical protein VTO42DRAFT_2953 [Malbranchea cinnamomea]